MHVFIVSHQVSLFAYRFKIKHLHPKNLCNFYYWMAEPVWAGDEGNVRRFEKNNLNEASFVRVRAVG